MKIKNAGKAVVCAVLEWQVKRLRRKHDFTVIAVVGSVGKTTTKLAIAHTLEPTRRVIYQTGNYNDRVTVPLVLFGNELPNLLNIIAWFNIFTANEQTIRRKFFYEFAVLELGTDHPGEIQKFAYLRPDITVVTAIVAEHMEYFETLDAVAAEELTVCNFSKQVIVNADDTPPKYLTAKNVQTYGLHAGADYRAQIVGKAGLQGNTADMHLSDNILLTTRVAMMGVQGVKISLAAAAAAYLGGLSDIEIMRGLQEIRPFAGRMQVLAGINGSVIIDDSYNASPASVIAALDVLYDTAASQRVAVLGNMNELGTYSAQAHEEVGGYCHPDKLDLVVTIGGDAGIYLAAKAKENGCRVNSFDNPYAAGEYVKEQLKPGAAVLVEGSQNGVFAEEVIKPLLANPADASKLVRQSKYWLGIKAKQFS